MPDFFKSMPDETLEREWAEWKTFQMQDTALTAREKHLIGLGGAASPPRLDAGARRASPPPLPGRICDRLGRVPAHILRAGESMKVRVYVVPKQGILDPQGAAVERSLPNLGFEGVSGVRIGKIIDLTIDGAGSEEAARSQVDEMCRKLLANPIIEDYTFEITEG